MLQTEEGIFLRFPLKEVPEMKKATLGVKGIKLMMEILFLSLPS